MTRKLLLFAVAGALALAAALPAAGSGPALVRHPVAGLALSIAVPATWQEISIPASVTPAVVKRLVAVDAAAAVLENPSFAHAGVRFIANEPNRQGYFSANVNLIVKPLVNLSLRQWFFAGSSAAAQYVGKTSNISINGAGGLHYRSTKLQKLGTVPLLTDTYAFARGGRVFMFTYTALAADASTYLPTFTASAHSIQFSP